MPSAKRARLTDSLFPDFLGSAPRAEHLFPLGLAHTDVEAPLLSLPVPDVPEIHLDLTREEELVRGGEDRERTALPLEQDDSVARAKRNGPLIDSTTEAIVLPVPGDVPPAHTPVVIALQPAQPGAIDVRDRWLGCRRHGLLANQVGSFVNGESKAPFERAQRQAVKRNLEPHTIPAHPARFDAVLDLAARHLRGIPGEPGVHAFETWHIQRRVPEDLPFLLLHDFRRGLAAQVLHRPQLLVGNAALSLRYMELWAGVLHERCPMPRPGQCGHLPYDRLGALQAEPCPELPG